MVRDRKAEEKVLMALRDWWQEETLPPTLRELAQRARLASTWTVRYHLRKLADRGLVTLRQGTARGIFLRPGLLGVPLVSRISAGLPATATENLEGRFTPADLLPTGSDLFALRVKGESMTGAGINDGDIVFIRAQVTARNGDIVAARLDDEAVLKRYFLRADGIHLVAEHPAYPPLITREAHILGVLAGVARCCRPDGRK